MLICICGHAFSFQERFPPPDRIICLDVVRQAEGTLSNPAVEQSPHMRLLTMQRRLSGQTHQSSTDRSNSVVEKLRGIFALRSPRSDHHRPLRNDHGGIRASWHLPTHSSRWMSTVFLF